MFWKSPATGTDSQAGIIIHASSLFAKNGDAQDYVDYQSTCQALALSNSSAAIENAESVLFPTIGLFVEKLMPMHQMKLPRVLRRKQPEAFLKFGNTAIDSSKSTVFRIFPLKSARKRLAVTISVVSQGVYCN